MTGWERNDFALIGWLWRDWSPGFVPEPGELESVKATLAQPGVRFSALAYYRAMFSRGLEDSRKMNDVAAQPITLPTLAITGANDSCLDTRFFDHVPQGMFPNGLQTERIEGAGHFTHQEDPKRVNALLGTFLREHSS